MKPGRKRKLVDEVRGEWQVSIRKACAALEFDRSTYHYKSRRSGQAALETRIREICHARVRYGYRRVHVLLRREGWRHGQNKTRRIYRELGLQLRNKAPKRRVKAKLRDDHRPATRANETWAMDFVHDQLATGQKLRVLTIVDTFSRFSPAVDPRFSYRGEDVVTTLERICKAVGYPKTIRVDQGSEFISRDLDIWAYQKGVVLDFSRPGKPTDNSFIESFNGKFRSECLNTHWFLSLDDARRKMEDQGREYTEIRPPRVTVSRVADRAVKRLLGAPAASARTPARGGPGIWGAHHLDSKLSLRRDGPRSSDTQRPCGPLLSVQGLPPRRDHRQLPVTVQRLKK